MGGQLVSAAETHLHEHEGKLDDGKVTLETALAEKEGKSEVVAKKRTLTEMQGGFGEGDMEAYKRSRAMVDDPMAKYLGKDELVH